jgi:hypothetical protein
LLEALPGGVELREHGMAYGSEFGGRAQCLAGSRGRSTLSAKLDGAHLCHEAVY